MILALISRLFVGEAGIFVARLKRLFGLYVMLAIFAILTIVFLLIALFVWSSQNFGSLNTALIFAGVAFVFVVILSIMLSLARRKPKTDTEERLQRDIASIAGVAALSNAPQLVKAMRQKRGLIILPVAAAGFYGLYRLIAAMRER